MSMVTCTYVFSRIRYRKQKQTPEEYWGYIFMTFYLVHIWSKLTKHTVQTLPNETFLLNKETNEEKLAAFTADKDMKLG